MLVHMQARCKRVIRKTKLRFKFLPDQNMMRSLPASNLAGSRLGISSTGYPSHSTVSKWPGPNGTIVTDFDIMKRGHKTGSITRRRAWRAN